MRRMHPALRKALAFLALGAGLALAVATLHGSRTRDYALVLGLADLPDRERLSELSARIEDASGAAVATSHFSFKPPVPEAAGPIPLAVRPGDYTVVIDITVLGERGPVRSRQTRSVALREPGRVSLAVE